MRRLVWRSGVAALAFLAASPGAARVRDPAELRGRAVAAARRQLGHRYRDDCSGFVMAVYSSVGVRVRLVPARSRSESLFRASRRVEAPRPGDLAFFHHTYDRNRDGRADDLYTHVALVEAVRGPTVILLHRSSRGIERIRMDLTHPSDPERNDPVRALRRGDDPATRTLAGELFAGFGALPQTL